MLHEPAAASVYKDRLYVVLLKRIWPIVCLKLERINTKEKHKQKYSLTYEPFLIWIIFFINERD